MVSKKGSLRFEKIIKMDKIMHMNNKTVLNITII
jgi:hypothetical protein